MAAYASLVSLMHITHQIENHPSPPISLQKQQVQSLTEAVTFLQEFLEGYVSPFSYSDEADPLEMRIADAAYAVEDVIDSYIVDTIHLSAASTTQDDGGEASCIDFCKSLQKVIEDMGLIVKEAEEIVSEKAADKPQMQMQSDAASHGGRKSEMVGSEDVLLQLLDRLTGSNLNRQIIPITGMGGIGKTTLARNAFENKLINEHFDVCLWATISQDYNIEQTLREVLSQNQGREHSCGEERVNELGEKLYKYLYGRRYLVVMDDMWSIEVWDKMRFFYPDNNNGSRVIVTTRLSNLAVHLTDSNSLLDMRFLDEVNSWNLFSKTVFGEECFPFELERIGKKIVKNCHGLPLAIVVIGGLMAKSQHTQEYWEHIEKNLNSILNTENDGHCSRVLRLSYNHLPAYLKPCFLYTGVFEEDSSIGVGRLIKLWVSEGFLKPKNNKSLETVGKEYLKELLERNLIMVHYKFGSRGKKKFYQIHDLLRDLSLKEAQKQRFCYVFKGDGHRDINSPRRIVIHRTTSEEEVVGASKSMSHARSYVFYLRIKQLPDFRLLRTLHTHEGFRLTRAAYDHALEDVFQLVNSRYLSVSTNDMSQVPSSINLLWNLHTLVIYCKNELVAPVEIWRMHQLKHVLFESGGLRLPDLPSSESDIVILENLLTLKRVNNFDLNEEVARRIPNIRKLEIDYEGEVTERVNCLSYLQCLSKLVNLECTIMDEEGRDKYLEEMIFPGSLRNLLIWSSDNVELEHILSKIGSLPFLQTLTFRGGFFRTRKWETVEGQFPSLKSLTLSPTLFLKLSEHEDLEKWTMPDSPSCFPLLEHLCLADFEKLEEIPREIGEIPTLKSIKLMNCSESAVLSAKRIVEEREDLYGEDLDLHVEVYCKSDEQAEALQYLATPNFHVSVLIAEAEKAAKAQIRYFNFYEGLQKVIEAMGLIKKEDMEMEMEIVKEKDGLLEAELQRNVSVDAGPISSSIERKGEMVGFDDVRLELLDKLTGGDSNRQIIPIVGMGGIGKTTLARNVFADKFIEEHFDICVWATISLDHDIERTLREVLSHSKGTGRSSGDDSVAGLGEELYKCLFGRRYLVVMDDMWSVEVWDKIRNFFPECNQRSRIIVTTRMSNLAAHLTNSSNSLCLSFLNGVDSWTLFSKTVFGIEGSDPDLELELREIGEKIVFKCSGLPLSIVVIGGLLAKSELTQGYWEYIENNLNSIVNLENEEYCLKVLKLSYNHLPVYLKPCFLYMGVFDEDSKIEVSTVINLWVSEGFIKPKKKKNLLAVGREYLEELVDRNLLLAHEELASRWSLVELGSVGIRKMCKIHDLVRDVSLIEAQRQRFYYVYSKQNPSSHPRRIVIPKMITRGDHGLKLESSPHPRSYICHDDYVWRCPDFRLLRILHTPFSTDDASRYHEYRQDDVFRLVNSRLLTITANSVLRNDDYVLLSSISRLWTLHTLIVYHSSNLEGPVEFWNMHQLKHVEFASGRLRLQPPPPPTNNDVIMENLHTLIGMKDFHLNEDVVRRIPNLTILDVSYGKKINNEVHSLSYLQRFSKLEGFRCSITKRSGQNLLRICFPRSLKQIILLDGFCSRHIEWEDVLQNIGELRLPFLEELAIKGGYFRSGEWETIEGQFPRLKSLQLDNCRGLEYWTVSEASHFPLLQNLILLQMEELDEIPSEIGEIATLKSIGLSLCSESAVLSAKKIVEEQEDLYGAEELSFHVLAVVENEALESLASPNFIVKLR